MKLSFCLIFTLINFRAISSLQKESDEERNHFCCSRKLRCCEKEPPIYEARAVLVNCRNPGCCQNTTNDLSGPKRHVPAEKCGQKLLLTIKSMTRNYVADKSQYIVIDHISDYDTQEKTMLLNPIVVKLRQELLEYYAIAMEHVVNAEVQEMVDYEGCEAQSKSCQPMKYQGQEVPFSGGFCCACNATIATSQSEFLERDTFNGPKPAIPDYNKNRIARNNYKHYEFIEPLVVKYLPDDGYGTNSKRSDRSVNYKGFSKRQDFDPILHRKSRCIKSCDHANQESNHCIKFSKFWYEIYRLEKPEIHHKLALKIYQKFENQNDQTLWKDLTQQRTIQIGTKYNQYTDETISVKYSAKAVDDCTFSLDYKKKKLLIPEKETGCRPEEYLVVPENQISSDGKTCDVVGVGYEAFFKQSKRCLRPPGSCLGNQPKHLREHDLKAGESGEAGLYFLRNFGLLTENPVTLNASGRKEGVSFYYTKSYTSLLDFEIKLNFLGLIERDNLATITEVYVDATYPKITTITAKITNSGLVASAFYLRLSGCPLEVPASFNNIATKPALISPQNQHIYEMKISCPLPTNQFYCNIDVYNIDQKFIASRMVRFQKNDRCICVWYCSCACYLADQGLKCHPLSLDSYHAAGFQGGYPISSQILQISYFDYLLKMFFMTFLFVMLILLILGLIKAVLGVLWGKLALWGIDTIFGFNQIDLYCKSQYCPNKKIGKAVLFCVNFLFFFIYPLTMVNNMCKSLLATKYSIEKLDDACQCNLGETDSKNESKEREFINISNNDLCQCED